MQCHACGNTVAADDHFCTACGASLDGVTNPTERLEPVVAEPADPETADPQTAHPETAATANPETALPGSANVIDVTDPADAGDEWGDDDPVWAATGSVDVVGRTVHPSTDQLPMTQPITEVRTQQPMSAIVTAESDERWHDGIAATTAATTTVTTTPATAELPVFPRAIEEQRRFRFTAVLGLSVLGAIVTLLGLFATVVTITSNARLVRTPETPAAFRTGEWITTDLADNIPIAGLIAACLMVGGGVASAFGWRGGSGLAGGAGLATAGIAALAIGLAQYPIDAAYEMAAIPSEQQFTLTITRDLGYWLLVGAGAIGIVVFFASVNDALGDRRAGLNPWIAALGALAGLVMAGGPLIPEQLASFSDNWYVSDAPGSPPAMLLTARLVQLALLALAALIGFLAVRRWGLGIAIGGGLPPIWLTVSTMLELGDDPVGPGYRNPGSTVMDVHGVTIIGASALAAFALLAVVAAYDQTAHGR
jgi:hypothetical protein